MRHRRISGWARRAARATRAGLRACAWGVWMLVAHEDTKQLDTGQLVFLTGLGAASYGAWLIYVPAGFLLGGLVLVWLTLPARPPFIRTKE